MRCRSPDEDCAHNSTDERDDRRSRNLQSDDARTEIAVERTCQGIVEHGHPDDPGKRDYRREYQPGQKHLVVFTLYHPDNRAYDSKAK